MNEVQDTILQIFREAKTICERHGIPYFAIGGTCIGAVRHNGFIPWDDDLDIAIPIEDYDRFLEIAKKELPEHFSVYTCDDIRHYRYIFAKIIDSRTTFIEKNDVPYPDSYKGIFLDVMPISGVPASAASRKRFLKRIHRYTTLNTKMRFPTAEFRKWQARALSVAMLPLRLILKYTYFSDRYLNMLRKHPFASAEYTGYVWSLSIDRLIFPKEWFASQVELPFENTTIACPKEWDRYLSQQFHDYMRLPPEGERMIHSEECVDAKKSYKEYQKEGFAL